MHGIGTGSHFAQDGIEQLRRITANVQPHRISILGGERAQVPVDDRPNERVPLLREHRIDHDRPDRQKAASQDQDAYVCRRAPAQQGGETAIKPADLIGVRPAIAPQHNGDEEEVVHGPVVDRRNLDQQGREQQPQPSRARSLQGRDAGGQ